MQLNPLGRTDLEVSRICLGSMTWGEQNNREQAFAQLDYALDHGINFIDTAELYSIPPRAETYGRTEQIIGEWLKSRGNREQVTLASKIAGPGEGWVDHIRNGRTRFDAGNIAHALDASLKRLNTDCIDLYQLHWPERQTNFFGQLGYQGEAEPFTPIAETLLALDEQVKAGKIRHIGLSNETSWGVMRFLATAEARGLPRVVSVQNPYSLLNRSFEVGLAEVAMREQTGLLAYSPLGFGVLSGKYLQGAKPGGARITRWPHYQRYSNEQSIAATQAYVDLARGNGLDPAQMALAYVNSRPFLTSTIIGATDMEQLRSNIASASLQLSDEVLEGIEAIHQQWSNPAP